MRKVSTRTITAAVLVVAAAIWALVNKPFEGAVLWVMSPGHGLTVGDLPSIAAVLAAVALVIPWRGAEDRSRLRESGR